MKHIINVRSNMTKKELESYLAKKEAVVETTEEIDGHDRLVDSILFYEGDSQLTTT